MNILALRQLKAQMMLLNDSAAQRVVCAIDCALMNTHESITKEWLREELERYLRRQFLAQGGATTRGWLGWSGLSPCRNADLRTTVS